MLTRRAALLSPLAFTAARTVSFAQGGMTLAMHQNTSSGAGYRGSLEGWARAGIRHVELNAGLVDQFLETDTMAAARRVRTDNGLTPVSGSVGVGGLWEPNPDHAAALETLRRRCEMFAELGLEMGRDRFDHACAAAVACEVGEWDLRDEAVGDAGLDVALYML